MAVSMSPSMRAWNLGCYGDEWYLEESGCLRSMCLGEGGIMIVGVILSRILEEIFVEYLAQ